MCGVCGCGEAEMHGHDCLPHEHTHDGVHHAHDDAHPHEHPHHHEGGADESRELRHATRFVRVERDIQEKNNRFAEVNRRLFGSAHTLALNLLSGPGAGKTSLLVRTLHDLAGKMDAAVIEGDQQTSLDAERIKATGVPVVQINTGKMCHLDARMISEALRELPPPEHGVLFVENVGNLVCPSGFDLGEAAKVVLVSVTEGEDKPLKYPDMFHAAQLVVVTKTDLLPHLDFDVALLGENIGRVNPSADVLLVSARTGEGLDGWYSWLDARRKEVGVA